MHRIRIKKPLVAASVLVVMAGGAVAFAEAAGAATNLSVTLSAHGTGSSAKWDPANPVLTVGPGAGSDAQVQVNSPGTPGPDTAPAFGTSSSTGTSPRWVIRFAGGDTLTGEPYLGANHWQVVLAGAGSCHTAPPPNANDTWAAQLNFINSVGCGGTVTAAAIVADALGTSDAIAEIQYNGQTLAPGADVVTVTSPGDQTSTLGSAIPALTIKASSIKGDGIASWSASGLPAGLQIDATTGTISGTPTTTAVSSVTVTATDNGGTKGSASFKWTVGTGVHTTYEGTIRLVRMGLCLDDQLNSSSNGAIVQVWGCNGLPNQNWQVMSDGTIQHNGLCLDARNFGVTNGTPLQLWKCTGGPNQKFSTGGWRIHYDNPNASGKVVDDTAFGRNGTRQIIFDNNGGLNQIWGTV